MSVKRKSVKSDLKRIDALKDKDIDYSDIPPLDASFFRKALVTWPPEKQTVTIRLDADVVEWLKKGGKGYQTRINHLLRRFMDASSKSRATR